MVDPCSASSWSTTQLLNPARAASAWTAATRSDPSSCTSTTRCRMRGLRVKQYRALACGLGNRVVYFLHHQLHDARHAARANDLEGMLLPSANSGT